jgi:hypothetical protein
MLPAPPVYREVSSMKKKANGTGGKRHSRTARAKRPGSAGRTFTERRVSVTVPPEFVSAPSATAVAAEALRTGVVPLFAGERQEEIPGEGERIRMGDPDDRAIDNEYVGDETPGGSSPTPDQNSVDDIGTAYGLQEQDAGPRRGAAEILQRRDRHRATMDEPPKRGRAYRR